MQDDELDVLLAEQVAYYRARAREYDATHAIDVASRGALLAAQRRFAARGRVLELACGTGQWTAELVKHASQLTAVDASPEMIALNRARVARSPVRYVKQMSLGSRRRSATTSCSSARGCRTSRRSASTGSGRSSRTA
jgi:demethylmenaquinone methyltransferase/2-methoxy-6-polyprenyl-1,4-benzoquinol methylase